MRATWLTDLHLNFLEEDARVRFLRTVKQECPDVIFLTGDTGESNDVFAFVEQIARIAPPYFVLGNHDFYGSSLADVRRRARETKRWLPALGPIRLTDATMLVGVDGWGDARCGNRESGVKLADWRWIKDLDELTYCPSRERIGVLNALGSQEATALRENLARVDRPRELIVLTHVPPFAEACWYNGAQSEPDWLPWFTCIAVGDALREYARSAPRTTITVLCGHSHGRGEYQARENLRVRTGGWPPDQRDYGNPLVQESWTLA